MYYPSSENKGTDQLRGYHREAGNREADLRLCFRLCRLLVFPWGGTCYMKNQEKLSFNYLKMLFVSSLPYLHVVCGYMSHVMRKYFTYTKTNAQISFAVTAKLISALVFATTST